ncbi:amidohydrolase [soil metagenome]
MVGRITGAQPGDDSLLLVGADVRTLDPSRPRATSVLIRRRRIAWVGDDPEGAVPPDCQKLDLTGTIVQPAFVNAHTHLTALGLMLGAVDLAMTESLEDCLAAIRAMVGVTTDPLIWAVGWDETRWPEHRAPTADELTAAGDGRPVMLSRADGHCVAVDRISLIALPLARARGVERGPDGRPTGILRQEAAQTATRWFAAELPPSTLTAARSRAATALAEAGVASAHEMGGPHRMGPDDFDAWMQGEWPIEVVPYWGDADLEFVAERGLRRVGGSLLLDGTVGSHSAALTEPYADKGGSGQLYLDTTELADFALQATHKGVQVALHAIGDRAVEQAATVFESVAEQIGTDQLRRLRHRLEYAVLIGAAEVQRLADLGVVVTAQPANDLDLAAFGGSYEQRLGPVRARAANPLGALHRAGVPLAFGSDKLEALDPWASVHSAVTHHDAANRMSGDDALWAATIGGRVAARQPNVGPLRIGHRADLAVFDGEGGRCLLTIVAGTVVHGMALVHS